jgi:hypothetical protein
VTVNVVLDPPDAALEVNGTLTSARRFELERGTEAVLIARRSGHEPERMRLVAERAETVELVLPRSRRRARRRVTAEGDLWFAAMFGDQ